jgi:DNA-binding SARP family transcriptional activator
VEDQTVPFGEEELDGFGSGGHLQDSIRLLQIMQRDYQGARKQLEQVNQTLTEREAMVNQRLQYALWVSGGYQTLSLTPWGVDGKASRIGRVVLGEMVRPAVAIRSTRLEINCLGRFEIRSEWGRIDRWHSARAKSVLQYILNKPRESVIKDVLMETLWPDCSPQAAGNNLKAAMHGLRRTLDRLSSEGQGYPYILFLQGSYRINPEIELWVDVEEFEQCWLVGRRLEREGKKNEAIQEFRRAEKLYRGDYLEDEPYEDWTLLRRESLRDTYLIVLGKLADHAMDVGDYEDCIVYCQKIMAKDPCREDAYRRLMQCHNRLGRRNRALHWYEICRRTIKAELETTPDTETTALYQKLLRNESI